MSQAAARIGRPRRLAIDVPAVANLVGTLGKYLGLAALFPIPFAIGYGEPFFPFVVAGVVTSGLGYVLERWTADAAGRVSVREGFLVVALTWLLAAAFASIPYLFEGGDQLSSPLDAYFEGMSGFTTTGASVVTDYDEINQSLGIWRQFTQWLGGMGIIVLAIAVLPRLRVGGRQLMESELPGPEIAALGERIRSTARKLWFLYVALTLIQVLMLSALWVVGLDELMTPYEALAHAFATMPTGGFSTQPDQAAAFSAEAQWILTLFMAIAGANFALMYRAVVHRQPRVLARDEEFRLYVLFVVGASAALAVMLWGYGIVEGEGAVRTAAFQAVSIMTTTGMASADFALWPPLLLLTLFALMFIGGSAGSTGGSIKVVRHLLLGKMLRREIDQTLSPEVVLPIRLNGAPVDERTIRAVAAFILLYVGFWAVGASVIAIDSALSGVDVGTLDALAASATTLGNVGPAFGLAGPYGSFADFGEVSKITMIGLMWVGRLEIVPVVVLATRHYWRL
ncbi:MAG TPA: TrkH family potassium uptake protein [Gaiellaceae bacterium]|nr:TrkH family potassium uptake protein [Gaiellaceae bacterium]